MPRAKSTKYYPTEFFTIAEKIGKMLAPGMTLQFPSEREAKSLQGRYYAFVGALRKEASEGPLNKTAIEEADWKYKAELLPFAQKVYVTTNGKGEISFKHRSESWYAKAMAEGLAKLSDAPPTALQNAGGDPTVMLNEAADVAASLARLQGMIKPGEPLAASRDYASLRAQLGIEKKPASPDPTPATSEAANPTPIIKE